MTRDVVPGCLAHLHVGWVIVDSFGGLSSDGMTEGLESMARTLKRDAQRVINTGPGLLLTILGLRKGASHGLG